MLSTDTQLLNIIYLEADKNTYLPGCIPCKTHAGVMSVAPQVQDKVEGWRTPKVQRSNEICVQICILLRQYAKEYSLGYFHATTKTGKLAPSWRSSGLSAWNAPWQL